MNNFQHGAQEKLKGLGSIANGFIGPPIDSKETPDYITRRRGLATLVIGIGATAITLFSGANIISEGLDNINGIECGPEQQVVVVSQNDSLWKIAGYVNKTRFDNNLATGDLVDEIMSRNNLDNAKIQPSQGLVVPTNCNR